MTRFFVEQEEDAVSETHVGKIPPKLYIDPNVLVYYLKPRYRRDLAEISKRFLNYIERGRFKGVVSTIGMMEIIKIIREILVEIEGVHNPDDWKREVDEAIKSIYGIENIQIVEGKHDEMPTEPPEKFHFSGLVRQAFTILRNYSGKTGEDRERQGRYVHDGLYPMDALHIALAKAIGCDKIATFDQDFAESKAEIPPLNLIKDTW